MPISHLCKTWLSLWYFSLWCKDVHHSISIENETHNSRFSALYLYKIKLNRKKNPNVKKNLHFHNGSNVSYFSSQKRALEGQKKDVSLFLNLLSLGQTLNFWVVYFRNRFSYSSQDSVNTSGCCGISTQLNSLVLHHWWNVSEDWEEIIHKS